MTSSWQARRVSDGGRLALARRISVLVVVAVGVWAAYDTYMPFWSEGASVAGVLLFVAAFTLVPDAIASALALYLRRRDRLMAIRYLVLFGQAAWAAFMAALAFG